jgi:hypothetical protein
VVAFSVTPDCITRAGGVRLWHLLAHEVTIPGTCGPFAALLANFNQLQFLHFESAP